MGYLKGVCEILSPWCLLYTSPSHHHHTVQLFLYVSSSMESAFPNGKRVRPSLENSHSPPLANLRGEWTLGPLYLMGVGAGSTHAREGKTTSGLPKMWFTGLREAHILYTSALIPGRVSTTLVNSSREAPAVRTVTGYGNTMQRALTRVLICNTKPPHTWPSPPQRVFCTIHTE